MAKTKEFYTVAELRGFLTALPDDDEVLVFDSDYGFLKIPKRNFDYLPNIINSVKPNKREFKPTDKLRVEKRWKY